MEFIATNFVPVMFIGLLVFLLMGFPVAFSLAATGLFFGFIGMEVGLFPSNLFQALPLRVFGIMQNDTLLAIPFFTFMGIILENFVDPAVDWVHIDHFGWEPGGRPGRSRGGSEMGLRAIFAYIDKRFGKTKVKTMKKP